MILSGFGFQGAGFRCQVSGFRVQVSGFVVPHSTDYTEPTVLWRLRRGQARAHATIFSDPSRATVSWFFDGLMDRVENYESIDLAMARADQIRGVLLRDGWTDDAAS